MSLERSDAELVSELERLSLELMQRLLRRAEESKGDSVAADQLFLLAGQAEAALRAATGQLGAFREELDRSVREGG